jgi:hypothetical protein
MKKILFTFATLLISMISTAQSVEGNIKINEQSRAEISLKSNKIVNLYAAFREQQHKIQFSFSGNNLPQNDEKKEIVQFVFITTVKKDGKVIGSMKRAPIPFFPGDMLMPIETFDAISILSNLQTNAKDKVSEIAQGNYEITFEAKPIGVKGEIKAGIIWFKI